MIFLTFSGRLSLAFERLGLCLAIVGCGFAQDPAPAKPATQPGTPFVGLAGADDRLHVLLSDAGGSLVFSRTRYKPFDQEIRLDGVLESATSGGDALYVFTRDGRFWTLTSAGWRREIDLPATARPIALTANREGVFSLIDNATAGALPAASATSEPATSFQPKQPDAYSIARYRDGRWAVVAECPAGVVHDKDATELLTDRDSLLLFQGFVDQQVRVFRLELPSRTWQSLHTLGAPGMRRFLATSLNGAPCLIAAATDSAAAQTPRVFRLLDTLGAAQPEFRETRFEWSTPLDDHKAGDIVAAVGFNDHLALLRATSGGAIIQFGRPAAAPTEPTVAVKQLIDTTTRVAREETILQWLLLLMLAAVITGLLVFRHTSLTGRSTVPAGIQTAFALQRLIGGLIDFSPFALVWASAMRIEIRAALGELSGWSFSAATPPREMLLWWAIVCGSYACYCLIMEVLTGRTIGKVILGLRVLSESGDRPTFFQFVGRNAVRLIELAPPFWILFALLILSRHRQRLGDIFARTLVIRGPLPAQPSSTPEANAAENDGQKD